MSDKPTPREVAKELYDHRLKAPPMFNEFGERRISPYYYFVNIRHPVIAALYARFKDENNIGAYPATDLERLEFEIGLLNEEARELVWKELQRRKEKEQQDGQAHEGERAAGAPIPQKVAGKAAG